MPYAYTMSASSIKLLRSELYREVWETPIHRLSAKYGLSDVGLAKVCRKMDIPRPPRGHWQRLKAGAKVRKAPLPPARKETTLEVTLKAKGPRAQVQTAATARPAVLPPEVGGTLRDPHPLVATTLQRFENGREDKRGLLVTTAKRILDVQVSRGRLSKAMRLLDALFKSWEAEGLAVKLQRVGTEGDYGTFLCSGEERLQITLTETLEEYDPGPTRDEELRPKWEWKKERATRSTGELHLKLRGDFTSGYTRFSRNYRDRGRIPIEEKARQIWTAGMNYFDLRADYLKRVEQATIAAERRRVRMEAEHKRYEEEWRRRQEEQEKVEKLLKAAAAWEKANTLRRFVEARAEAMAADEKEPNEIREWTDWALAAADAMDPLIHSP